MRMNIQRERQLYRRRGLGLWFEYGSTGTTLGDPRPNFFFEVHVLIWVEFTLYLRFKGRP